MERILITGATGQIGSELTLDLRDRYGNDKVLAALFITLQSIFQMEFILL